MTSEGRGIPQIKPRRGQGRAGLRWKIKLPMSPSVNKPICKNNRKTKYIHSTYEATKSNFKSSSIGKFIKSMTKLFQYQITQFLKQDLEMTQVLEQTREKPYRILERKFPYIEILFIDHLLNQQKYPYKKFLEIYWILSQK